MAADAGKWALRGAPPTPLPPLPPISRASAAALFWDRDRDSGSGSEEAKARSPPRSDEETPESGHIAFEDVRVDPTTRKHPSNPTFRFRGDAWTGVPGKVMVVANLYGGVGKPALKRQALEAFTKRLGAGGVGKVDVRVTERAAHATEMMERVEPGEYDLVVIWGGDGSITEVITGMMRNPRSEELRKQLAFTVVAGGSGNALAENLGLLPSTNKGKRKPLAERAMHTADVILGSSSFVHAADVGKASSPNRPDVYFTLIFSWGNTIEMFRDCEWLRRNLGMGDARYAVSGLTRVWRQYPQRPQTRMVVDDKWEVEPPAWWAPQKRTATGFSVSLSSETHSHQMTAMSALDDGVFEAFISPNQNSKELLSTILAQQDRRAFVGIQGKPNAPLLFRFTKLAVGFASGVEPIRKTDTWAASDGSIIGGADYDFFPFELSVVRGGVRWLVPKQPVDVD